MNKRILSLILISFIGLIACGSKDHPFAKADLKQVSALIYEYKTKDTLACAKEWASKKQPESCMNAAENLALLLNSNGFKDLSAQDVTYAPLWQAFNQYAAQKEAVQKPSEKMNEAFTW